MSNHSNSTTKKLFYSLLITLILASFAYTFQVNTSLSLKLDNHLNQLTKDLSCIKERLSAIEAILRGGIK